MGLEILEKWGGRIIAFSTRIENIGPGVNTVTENHQFYNTDEEKTLFKCTNQFYKDLSNKFFEKRITVDIFSCTFQTVNLANPAILCTATGGDVYYYRQFNEKYDGEKLHYDVFRILTRNNAYDVAFRVRWSEGYAVIAYIGNFKRINSIDFQMPSIDADKTIGVIMRSEGSITNTDKLAVQSAMLYSTPDGERKIRIFNLYLPLEKKFYNVFRYIDQDALVQLLIKQSLANIGAQTVVAIKEELVMSVVKILSAFRSEGVSVTNPTEILVPYSIRYLNLYILGALKSPAYKLLGEVKADEKFWYILKMLGNSMQRLIKLISPRMYQISDIHSSMTTYGYPDEETGKTVKPPVVDNTFDNLNSEDLCIIDDGEFIYLYVGRNVSSELVYDIFGYESFDQLHHYGVTSLEVRPIKNFVSLFYLFFRSKWKQMRTLE